MSKVFVAAIVCVLAMPAQSAAHRLDEYLQAARVSLARDRITLEVDLTPGANIASAIVSLLDRDGDNTISPIEAATYGRVVLGDLALELDGRAVAVMLTRVETPSIDDMRDGIGTIQLRAAGDIEAVSAGRRDLYFRNNHQPAASVYLVNALIPEDADVRVVAQRRDSRQQGVRVEYHVGPRWLAQLIWLVLGALSLSTLMVFRRARHHGVFHPRELDARACRFERRSASLERLQRPEERVSGVGDQASIPRDAPRNSMAEPDSVQITGPRRDLQTLLSR